MAISSVYLLIDNERSIGGIASHGSPTDTDPNEIDLEAGRDFIAPCKCKGTSKYVHRECLDHWRAVKHLRVHIKSYESDCESVINK
ncbi:hypothetical protein GOBAR_DD19729 [Gossypium barbadense]|nr:hypothetical protein GOBAR_DD19729 [Gossypium barbadense]